MAERLPCLVPGCRRTTDLATARMKHGDHCDWICARHWAAVPKAWRQRMFRYRRRAKSDPRWRSPAQTMWCRCRERAVTEALLGITL